MKKQSAILVIALLGLAVAACHKNETATGGGPQSAPTPAVSVEPRMREAYGFAARVPANTESYLAFYNLGKLWSDFKGSKTWAAIRANPLVSKEMDSPSLAQAKGRMDTNPEAAKWKAVVKETFGSEAFMAFAPGSGAKLKVWMEVNSAIRQMNFQQTVSGGKNQDPMAFLRTMLPYAKDLDVPPMIIGFKIGAQKATLDTEIADAQAKLPPFVETGTFNVGNAPFNSVAVTVSKALPPEQQTMLKNVVTANVSDAQKADAIYQALLARRIEVAYGYVDGYFILSIGPDHSQFNFAADYKDSILARPEVQAAADYTGKPLIAFSWCTAELQAAMQQQIELMSFYNGVKSKISETLSPSDIEKLETDLKRLDGEMKAVTQRDFTPMVSVLYRENGLHGEAFGGPKSSAAPTVMKFSGVPAATTFLWADVISSQARTDAFRTWFEDFSTTAYDTFQRSGLPYMNDQQRQQFAIFQQMAVPKLTELYKISRDQFGKSLGLENAFTIDLSAPVPALPMVPPDIQASGKMISLAYMSDVHDRALLTQSWTSYCNLATDTIKTNPALAFVAASMTAGAQPMNETVDSVSFSYLKPPMDTGDLLPNIAITNNAFIAGTSRSLSLALAKAAAKPATGKPMVLDLRVNFQPAFDFADKWLALAAQNPALFFKGDEAKAAGFQKSEPDIAALLHSLRAFDGVSVQAWDENGLPRTTSQLRWTEK